MLRCQSRIAGLLRGALLVVSVMTLASCTPPSALDDAARINGDILKVLTGGTRAICVDSGTRGEPLAIYRTMTAAPDPIRRTLGWYLPKPLADGESIDNQQLVDQELGRRQSLLRQSPEGKDRLPRATQSILNALASQGTLMVPDHGVSLQSTPLAPLAKVRWWVRNWFDPNCGPVYTVSEPVIFRDFAFVSVTAGHHGSIYAVQKIKNDWKLVAMWSTWLY